MKLLAKESVIQSRQGINGIRLAFIPIAVISSVYGWYAYNLYESYYRLYFPSLTVLIVLVVTTIGSSVFGLVSTTIVGMQTVVSNAVAVVALSHLELKKRFDFIYGQASEGAKYPMGIPTESNDQNLSRDNGLKDTETDTLKLMASTFTLLSHQ